MLLTCVCSLVGLQRLLPGENPVADVTADMAGGGLPLGDQLLDRVGTWPAAPDTILGGKEIKSLMLLYRSSFHERSLTLKGTMVMIL